MELRQGYKQTEVGVIPEDWEIVKLSDLADLTSSKRIFEDDYVDYGIPFFRGKEISLLIAKKQIDEILYITQEKYNSIKSRFGVPAKGDILITAVGTLGNSFLIPDDIPFYFKDGNLIWLRKINNIDSGYLLRQLERLKLKIIEGAIGSSQKALTIIVLKKLDIPCPTKIEQNAIAKALNDVDSLISHLEELITKKCQIKQGAMQSLLTGKKRLDGFGERIGYKQTDVGVIPEDWKVKKIGALFSFKNGLNKAKYFFGYGTPIINYMDVFNLSGLKHKDFFGKVDVTKDEIKSYGVKQGDVFFTRTSETVEEIGISAVLLDELFDGVFSGFVLRARPKNDELDLNYKKFCFSPTYIRKQISSTSSYTTRALTNGTLLSNVNIAFPPTKPEQTAIASCLSDMDSEISTLESKLTKIQNLKQGMMQSLLTGKIRLINPQEE